MASSPNDPFSVKWDKTKATTETIKWTLDINSATKHEIVSPILSKFELGNIVAHCLTVMHKIDAHVGNNAANRFAPYMNVFPHTLSLPHVVTWDTVLVDHPLAVQDVATFQQAIWHLIVMHATDEDRHELLDYICSIAKLCKMDIQMYYSCLHELNRQVDWLPGTDLPLTEDQLHQAFFDGMPTIWKEQYKNASRFVCNTTHADLLRFFHMQQKAAGHSQRANELKQRRESQTRGFRNSDCAVTQFYKKTKHLIKDDAKHQT
jgi:hypothetical protein